MNPSRAICLLIADIRSERFPLAAGQWAALRGIRCSPIDLSQGDPSLAGLGPDSLAAMSWSALTSLRPGTLRTLRHAVWRGATLYVRGGFSSGRRLALAPFAERCFTVSAPRRTGYRLAHDELLPSVLRNESVEAAVELPGAHVEEAVRPLAWRQAGGGLPFIFALRCGSGMVIYDLLADPPAAAAAPIAKRLADPAVRCFELGAMAAVNRAAGRGPEAVSAYNLVLDDRPCNFDYFNAGQVTEWLSAIERASPGAHVDFAWTPQHDRPSIRYINALKRFNTGFVWHGLHRHVDHRALRDPESAHRRGVRLVSEISRRYCVRFQPIMILPFQEVDPPMLRYLRDAGFLAAIFHADPRPGIAHCLPPFMHYSTPGHDLYMKYLPALRRYLAPELTRDNLIANAALDLPIIAAAHPFEVGLRRYAALYQPWKRPVLHFDEVLKFAREKRLRPLSLEEIAVESTAPAEPDLIELCAGGFELAV